VETQRGQPAYDGADVAHARVGARMGQHGNAAGGMGRVDGIGRCQAEGAADKGRVSSISGKVLRKDVANGCETVRVALECHLGNVDAAGYPLGTCQHYVYRNVDSVALQLLDLAHLLLDAAVDHLL